MTPQATTEERRLQRLHELDWQLNAGRGLTETESLERLRLDYMCTKRNLSQINDNLFLGRNRASLNEDILLTFGITHIVNCARDCRKAEHHANFGYLHIKAKDNKYERLAPCFERTSAFIDDAIASGGKVLIHCYAGVSRSATILLAYLMAKRRMSLPVAFNLVQDKRSIIKPNAAFCAELRCFEKKLFGAASAGRLHDKDIWTGDMDWKEAMRSIFRAAYHKEVVERDTGQCHLLWTKFKEAFAGDKHEHGIILQGIIAQGLEYAVHYWKKSSNSHNTRKKPFETLHAVLIMGMYYASCESQAWVLDRVQTALLMDDTISKKYMGGASNKTREEYARAFCNELGQMMDEWLDQRLFTYTPDPTFLDFVHEKIEVWPKHVDVVVTDPMDQS